jgi:hypothetical protein
MPPWLSSRLIYWIKGPAFGVAISEYNQILDQKKEKKKRKLVFVSAESQPPASPSTAADLKRLQQGFFSYDQDICVSRH